MYAAMAGRAKRHEAPCTGKMTAVKTGLPPPYALRSPLKHPPIAVCAALGSYSRRIGPTPPIPRETLEVIELGDARNIE